MTEDELKIIEQTRTYREDIIVRALIAEIRRLRATHVVSWDANGSPITPEHFNFERQNK